MYSMIKMRGQIKFVRNVYFFRCHQPMFMIYVYDIE